MLLGQYDTWSVSRPNMPPFRACEHASSAVYLDVIHIAIVCGKRDLLELRIGSIRSLDLSDLICLSASQQGQYDESIWPAA